MLRSHSSHSFAEWALRFGVFGTFLGHGIFGLQQKAGWFDYFAAVGIGHDAAATLLLLVGLLDVVVAFVVLVYPVRLVVLWAALWGLVTALIRPIAGEPIWDFVERWSNWAAPLALLFLLGWPKKGRRWLNVTDKS